MPKCKNKNCGKLFKAKFSSFDKCCSDVCLTEYRVQYAMKAAEKYRKDREKERTREWAIEKKERSEKIKTHGEYECDLEDEVRAICRLIDAQQPCIACSKFGKMAAGHRFSKGHNNTLRYSLSNLHLCCFQCNDSKSGNLDGYDEGLRRIYGKEYWEHVYFDLKRTYPIVKLSIPEIKEKIVIAKQIVKELKKIDAVYPPAMRLALRKKYDERLGIYL